MRAVAFTWHSMLSQNEDKDSFLLRYLARAEGQKLPPDFDVETLSYTYLTDRPYTFFMVLFWDIGSPCSTSGPSLSQMVSQMAKTIRRTETIHRVAAGTNDSSEFKTLRGSYYQ